jgi:hypothetical protein
MNSKRARKLEQMVVAAALVSGLAAVGPTWGGAPGIVENASHDTGLFSRTFGAGDEPFQVASRLGWVRGGEVLDDVRAARGGTTGAKLNLPTLGLPAFARMVPTSLPLTGGIAQFLKRPDYGTPRYFWEQDEERRPAVEFSLGPPDYTHLFPAWEMHLRMHSNFVANAIVPHLTPPSLQYGDARGQVTLSSPPKDEPPAQRSNERDR